MNSWKEAPQFEGYKISSSGIVKSTVNHNSKDTETIKTPFITGGYKRVKLWKDGESKNLFVHRLVAELFVPNPENKPCVNHLDGDKLNNHHTNLEWCTYKENVHHAINNGLSGAVGETNHNAKVTRNDVLQMRSVYEQGWATETELSEAYKISLNQTNLIVNYKSWTHL